MFDNDGTLWSEQPIYFQLAFALDRLRRWRRSIPNGRHGSRSRRCSTGDMKTLAAAGEKGLLQIMAATHAGMTTDEFTKIVSDWIATARHPRFHRPYTELVYQPMLELLAYLRANGFKTFIVSGGGIEFMRPWAEQVYGIPPEQVIGVRRREVRDGADGKPVLIKRAEGRVHRRRPRQAGRHQPFIGRRPIFAFGNSDGDLQMLQWTAGRRRPALLGTRPPHRRRARIRLRPQIHDRQARQGAGRGPAKGWTVVDMRADWRTVFAPS